MICFARLSSQRLESDADHAAIVCHLQTLVSLSLAQFMAFCFSQALTSPWKAADK